MAMTAGLQRRGPIALEDWRLLQLTFGKGPFGRYLVLITAGDMKVG